MSRLCKGGSDGAPLGPATYKPNDKLSALIIPSMIRADNWNKNADLGGKKEEEEMENAGCH